MFVLTVKWFCIISQNTNNGKYSLHCCHLSTYCLTILSSHTLLNFLPSYRSREYQLVGVVNKKQDKERSLYSAYCRRLEGGRWGLWGGDGVMPATRGEVLVQRGAHLLFYLQKEEEEEVVSGRLKREVGSSFRTREGILNTCV